MVGTQSEIDADHDVEYDQRRVGFRCVAAVAIFSKSDGVACSLVDLRILSAPVSCRRQANEDEEVGAD